MLFLASKSPRRKQLLKLIKKPFRVVRSKFNERMDINSRPSFIAMYNARGKAINASLPNHARGIVIGADTFLYFKGRIIGKPKTLKEARKMLKKLSGNAHWVYTGVCLYNPVTNKSRTSWARSMVRFKPMSREAIVKYSSRAKPLDKAGGYALQADRGDLIESISGSRTNVIGLPIELLRAELRKFR